MSGQVRRSPEQRGSVAVYVLRRIGQAVAVVWLNSVVVFVVLHELPGGAAAMLGKDATQQQVAQLNSQLGLDRPVPVQYLLWLNGVVHGNLGFSIARNEAVSTLISQYLPKTILLTAIATAVALVLAVAAGLVQAQHRNRPGDYSLTAVFLFLYSTPVFFLAIVLVLVFAVKLRLLPTEAPQAQTIGGILAHPAGLVLPAGTLALVTIAWFSRYVRVSAIQNLAEDFVRTARAKGAGTGRILWRHVLRNTLLPVITLLGLNLPYIFGGALIVESVFNYPGAGWLFWQSATQHDYPVLLALALIVSAATVVGSLVADLLYAEADPRVRYTA